MWLIEGHSVNQKPIRNVKKL